MNSRHFASALALLAAASACSDGEDTETSAANGGPVPGFGAQTGTGGTGMAAPQALVDGTDPNLQNSMDDGTTEAVGNPTLDGSGGSAAVEMNNGTAQAGTEMSGGGMGGSADMSMGGSGMGPMGNPSATASTGCATAGAAPAVDSIANNLIFFPAGYDGSTPLPLVFGFHGAGRTNEDQRLVDSRTDGGVLEQNFIVAYMKSAGNGWDLGTDRPRFEAARAAIFAQLCVDTSSVYAFGHSSGAQFITQMLGTGDPEFSAVSVVASSDYGNPDWEPVPTLVIHGLNDNQRGGDNDGAQDLSQYTASNQCSEQTQAVNVTACNSIAQINGQNPAVNSGCREFMGCGATTIFCNHDDPNYVDNGTPTNHGWPCFANAQIVDFFQAH